MVEGLLAEADVLAHKGYQLGMEVAEAIPDRCNDNEQLPLNYTTF